MGYYVSVEPNVKVYVEDLNPSGYKTIVFLHGWPGSHKLFEYQFNELSKRRYSCVGINQRGFGKSNKPWSGYDYDTLAKYVRCVFKYSDFDAYIVLSYFSYAKKPKC